MRKNRNPGRPSTTEVETLDRQLSQTRTQFEHYQEATVAQRAKERQGYERRVARLEQELADARAELAGKARETELLVEQLRRVEARAAKLAEEKTGWLQERGALLQRVQPATLTGSTTSS